MLVSSFSAYPLPLDRNRVMTVCSGVGIVTHRVLDLEYLDALTADLPRVVLIKGSGMEVVTAYF